MDQGVFFQLCKGGQRSDHKVSIFLHGNAFQLQDIADADQTRPRQLSLADFDQHVRAAGDHDGLSVRIQTGARLLHAVRNVVFKDIKHLSFLLRQQSGV